MRSKPSATMRDLRGGYSSTGSPLTFLPPCMHWHESWRADPQARALADKHYNRQKIGAPQFVPPGRCLVLITEPADAFWITSYPFAQYTKHAWAGAMVCSAFRNEGGVRSSLLVEHACAATRWYAETNWGGVPELGMITFVDPTKVRRKRDWGRCYRKAGFVHVGETKAGLVALQLKPEDFPAAMAPKSRLNLIKVA